MDDREIDSSDSEEDEPEAWDQGRYELGEEAQA